MARAAIVARPRRRRLAARRRLTTEDRAFRDNHGFGPEPDPDRSAHGTAASWPALVGFVGLSLLVGAADAVAIPPASQSWLLSFAPASDPLTAQLVAPGMVAPTLVAAAWTVLSLPGGVAAWLAWRQPGHRSALMLWGWHLLAFAVWMQSLLTLRQLGPAMLAAIAMALLTCLTAAAFVRLRRAAGLLLFPGAAWTCYVACVTIGIWWLNRG